MCMHQYHTFFSVYVFCLFVCLSVLTTESHILQYDTLNKYNKAKLFSLESLT